MQLVAVLCVLLVAAARGAPGEKYSDKYDNLDIDNLLMNDRVVTQYVNCLLDKEACTPEGSDFRKYLPEALTTHCMKCSEPLKNILRKASQHIITKRPQDWELVKKKYDPNGEHTESFKRFLAGN